MKYTLFLLLLFFNFNALGQKSLGQWSEYLSYRSVTDIVEGNNLIYAACQNNLFSFNRDDNSISRYSSVNGLSDKHISTINWNDNNNHTIGGYENGNIDLISEDDIYNFSDIKRSAITSDKKINSFYNEGDFVWVSTGFGIVKINIVDREVVETYIIGNNGSEARVNNVVINNGNVFASTETGIYEADLNSSLQDFNNWTQVEEIPPANYKLVFNLGGHLGAFLSNDTAKQVYRRLDNVWQLDISDTNIQNVFFSNNHLLILRYNWLRVKGEDFNNALDISDYDFTDQVDIKFGYIDAAGNGWVGDGQWGLIEHIQESSVNYYQPEGPYNNTAWRVSSVDDELWIAHGGVSVQFTSSYKSTFFSGRTNNTWQQFAKDGTLTSDDVVDVIDVAINPKNTSQVFFGTWIGGLVEKKSDGNLEVYRDNNGNSVIQSFGPSDTYRVGGVTFDSEGNLWMSNANDDDVKQLVVSKVNGEEKNIRLSKFG